MAITIIDQPYSWSPRGQKLMVIANSDNASNPLNLGFKYRVTVDNTTTGETLDFYVSPAGDTSLYFDVSPLLKMQNMETATMHAKTMTTAYADVKAINVLNITLKEYWLVAGILTYNTGSDVELDEFAVVNGYYQVTDGYKPNAETSTNPLKKYAMTNNTSLMMSDRTVQTHFKELSAGFTNDNIFIPVREADYGLMYIPADTNWMATNNVVQYRIILYDATLTSHIGAYQSITVKPILGLPIYPANINATTGYAVKPSAYPGWKFYRINIKGAGGAQVSKDYIFYNMCEYQMCDCNFENIRLGWVNSRSGWDYFNFTKRSEFTNEIDRKTYRKVLFNGTQTVFSAYDRGLKQRQNIVQRVLTVTSDYIQKGEFELLRGLLVSNQVHWIQDNGTFIPVNVDDTSYVEKNTADGKLYNVTLKIRMANPYWT